MKFNAVAEWWEEYIACVNPLLLCYPDVETENRYEALKKQIYQLEKQQAGLRESYHDLEADESTSLIGASHPGSPDRLFIPLLDRELEKICLFYVTEEQRLSDEVTALQEEVERQEESGPYAGHRYLDADEDEDDEDDDDFDVTSPIESRDRTRSPGRRRRQHSLSLSGSGPSVPSGELYLPYVLDWTCCGSGFFACMPVYGSWEKSSRTT